MITKEEQLKNPCNWIAEDGTLFLQRCMNCANGCVMGTENWSLAVASGSCAWCGWHDEINDMDK